MITPDDSRNYLSSYRYHVIGNSTENSSSIPYISTQSAQESNHISPDLAYTISDYNELLEYLSRHIQSPAPLTSISDSSNISVIPSLLSHEMIETFGISILFASKLSFLRPNVNIQKSLCNIVLAMHNMDSSHYSIYRSLMKTICTSSIFTLPEDFRKKLFKTLLQIPSAGINYIINDNSEHSIWRTVHDSVKYFITPSVSVRSKCINEMLLTQSFPILINQIYPLLSTTLRTQRDLKMKYDYRSDFMYKHVNPEDYEKYFQKSDQTLISREIYRFNDNVAKIYCNINNIAVYINKFRQGLMFEDTVAEDRVESGLLKTDHVTTSGKFIIKSVQTIDGYMSNVNQIINNITDIVRRNNSQIIQYKIMDMLIVLYRKLQRLVLNIHQIIRCIMGYPQKRLKKRVCENSFGDTPEDVSGDIVQK